MGTQHVVAAVFDFDGLLADSEPLQIQAWETFLARYERTLETSLLQEMFGLRVMDSSRLVQERLALPISPEEVMAERDEVFLELVRSKLPLMPGAASIVHRFQQMDGISVSLATSGHQRYIRAALDVTGLGAAFDVIVTGDEVTQGKPEPDIYRLAAERLGVPPERCLAMEDAPHGIRSAKSAGMWCLAIPNDLTRAIPGLDEADAVLSHLDEVIPWLVERELLPSMS